MENKIEEITSCEGIEDFAMKLVIVGDSGVGKSNILTRYAMDEFSYESKATVGVELYSKLFKINDKHVKIHLWDTAGQERYKSITAAYYKGSKGAVIVYDVTRLDTFNNIDKWFNEIREHGEKNVQLIMIGNKCDLNDLRVIDTEKAMAKAAILGIPFMETSALNSTNINAAFKKLINEIYINSLKSMLNAEQNEEIHHSPGNFLKINNKNEEKTEKKNCC